MQTVNVCGRVREMYNNLPMSEACELHQRLNSGKADNETRQRLRAALRRAGLHRPQSWA